MCIVIDINAFTPVFSVQCEKHLSFSPVKNWIESGYGCLVFGGSTYMAEIKKNRRHVRLINQLKTAGKAIRINDQVVDDIEIQVVKETAGSTCDDQHIIALLGATSLF